MSWDDFDVENDNLTIPTEAAMMPIKKAESMGADQILEALTSGQVVDDSLDSNDSSTTDSVFPSSFEALDANGEIENTFEIPPDWTIEILSPDQSPTRVIDNILFCLNHGTELGWLIDPQEKLVMIFKPGKQPETKQDGDMLPVLSSLENTLQLSVQDLFSWLMLS